MNIIYTGGYIELLKTYNLTNWITIFGLLGYNTGPWIIPPAWSLDIEMQYYIFTPFIVYLFFRYKKPDLFLIILFLVWFSFLFDIMY